MFNNFKAEQKQAAVTSLKLKSLKTLKIHTAKKLSFQLRISSVNVTKSVVSCGFVTFTEETLNGKLYFLCSNMHLRKVTQILLCDEIFPQRNYSNMIFFPSKIKGFLSSLGILINLFYKEKVNPEAY